MIFHPPLRRNGGAALLLILGSLVLISILVVSFLISVRGDAASSNFYSSEVNSRQLADTATQLVMAQIAEATSDANLAWISQPGLLRTFDENGQKAAYKLYSSNVLKDGPAYNPVNSTTLTQELDNQWFNKPDEFVDLNEPVSVANSDVYPIVDPRAYDSTTPAQSEVEGFSYDSSSVKDTSGSKSTNELPMPVRWIYVMKDGSLATWAEVLGKATDPARQPVGRIAFWTDDECSKVNLNTAAGGVYFDSPAYNTREDYFLGRGQPVAQEYQRWPGHPATTSLAAVFKTLRNLTEPVRSQAASIITPRIAWGGTQGGTYQAWWFKTPVTLDSDRLYSSIDELSFGRVGSAWNNTSTNERYSVNDALSATSASLAADTLAKSRFFLTVNSRAPELNIFNRPRITLWPYNRELVAPGANLADTLTPEDRLIKFSSELGSNQRKLYFQRKYAWDPFYDYDGTEMEENRDLYAYLQDVTSKAPRGNSSRTGGTGRSFVQKFGGRSRDQILTETFDYLRSSTNTMNQSYRPVNNNTGKMIYSFPQGYVTTEGGYNDHTPLMIQTANGMTKGAGEAAALREVIFQFYCEGERFEGTDNNGTGTPIDNLTWNAATKSFTAGADGKPDYLVRQVRMVLLMDFLGSINNLNLAVPRFQVKVSGSPFKFGAPATGAIPFRPVPSDLKQPFSSSTSDVSMNFPSTGGDVNLVCAPDPNFGNLLGSRFGLMWPLLYPNYPTNKAFKSDLKRNVATGGKTFARGGTGGFMGPEYYPFFGDTVEFRIPNETGATAVPVPIAGASPSYKTVLKGASMTIEIYPGLQKDATSLDSVAARDPGNYLMRTVVPVADCTIPLPRVGPNNRYYPPSGSVRDISRRTSAGNLMGVPSPASTNTMATCGTYYTMRDYSQRLRFLGQDLLMLVPWDCNTSYGDGGTNKPSDASGSGAAAVNVPTVVSTTGYAPMDVFRSYTLDGAAGATGDARLTALNRDIDSSWWTPHPMYTDDDAFHGCNVFIGRQYPAGYINKSGTPTTETTKITPTKSGTNLTDLGEYAAALIPNIRYNFGSDARVASSTTNGAYRRDSSGNPSTNVGDFTTGYGGLQPDGGFIKGPDVGNISQGVPATLTTLSGSAPYFATNVSRESDKDDTSTGQTWNNYNFSGLIYSPSRQMPSPVVLGTLPSRALDSGGWETLLFCPNPSGGRSTHRGWTDLPRDHYYLDLFYMPTVEPYAITENFSTAGKINLNYQIAPFTYIKRATGLHALLRDQKITAVPSIKTSGTRQVHKSSSANMGSGTPSTSYRPQVDVAATLTGFDARFASNDPFVSQSEICEMFLVPTGSTLSDVSTGSYWSTNDLTSDDKREAPYNAIYPRVTTKSNTFQVHYRVQTLNSKVLAGRTVRTVTGEYRGSSVVERYLNKANQPYPSQFPALSAADYKVRVVNNKQFAP